MNLELDLFGNSLKAWLTALGIALAINLIVGLLKWLIIGRLSTVAKRTSTRIDDSLIGVVRSTRQWLVLLVTISVGARYLTLPEQAFTALKALATVAFFIQLGLWAAAVLGFWITRSRERAAETDLGASTSLGALSFIGSVLIWTLVLLLALSNLGINVTAMITGLGIGGIAVALAVQNILGDLFASLSIVIDKPFVIGDFIIVEDYMGSVEYVGLKTTRIRSLGGEQIIFSNSDLLKARVRNYKRMRERRVVFSFGVLYQTTPEQLEKIPATARAVIEKQKLARFDRAHFQKFGESSLDFEVVYWMLDPDFNKYMDVQQEINLSLLRAFADDGIGFAYPSRSLFIEGPVQLQRAKPAPAPTKE